MDSRISKYTRESHNKGERNNALYVAARVANDTGLPEGEARVVLGNRATKDGLSEHEIIQTIRSAYRAPREPIFVSTKHSDRLTWDSAISSVKLSEFELGDEEELPGPSNTWETTDLENYLKSLFKPEELIPYTKEGFKDSDDKWKPQGRGQYLKVSDTLSKTGTASQRINLIKNTEAGAWIRINPFDGKGIGNTNVTSFRHVLVESDTLSLEQQYNIIKTSRIPCAAIVHSGGKSIHAIVKIDAGDDYEKYKKRVESLYKFLESNGFTLDKQNKNPSRLSRFPGVWRGNSPQYLISCETGFPTWDEWEEWVANKIDGLPPIEDLSRLIADPPPLDPELIYGVLRRGHKLMLAGPSKSGKSFAFIWLALSLSKGLPWFKFRTDPTRVLYINLEIARASLVERFRMVAEQKHIPIDTDMIQVWNLRGECVSLDQLAPKLIQRIKGSANIGAVVFDPIYKILVGDENSNTDMGKFCNLLDSVANECGVSVIFSSHFSKGKQGDKLAIDRVSGAGVLGRDPDAIITLTELPKHEVDGQNAYRMEFVLREFATPPDMTWLFQHPIFVQTDDYGDVIPEGANVKKPAVKRKPILDLISFHGDDVENLCKVRKYREIDLREELGDLGRIVGGKVVLNENK